ncbi:hypothetical protein BOTBODRAFT_646663 [Botryobasidium botryosum FD-172 SS1]|uniref:C2H2-type domain-containing protein n=1 Tax=Botryobasidium botryosum (strain FD-172 SS1) TaxID=930990 RepID=A0A067MSA9_BOTB1|nr:hypothetical protein BOTBODRAFT_646663 [Botryobasidium botryosum FD-172 SS1]
MDRTYFPLPFGYPQDSANRYEENAALPLDTSVYHYPGSDSPAISGSVERIPGISLPHEYPHPMLDCAALVPPENPITVWSRYDLHHAFERPQRLDQDISASADSDKKVKRFACSGCDSTFERQSSLKQHMLTHTGERAHQCKLCGRRFSIPSNLRRHTKSCEAAKRRSGAESSSKLTTQPSASQDIYSSPLGGLVPVGSTPPREARRPSPYSKATHAPDINDISGSSTSRVHTSRRPSSSARQWLPPSLAHFSNASTLSSTPPFTQSSAARFTAVAIPLPPVRPAPNEGEERDSYHVSSRWPYHPNHWEGRLPGPGLLGDDELLQRPTVARRWMLNP